MGQRKILLVTSVAVLALVLPLAPAGAQAGDAGISGRVVNASGTGIGGICVTVHDATVRRAIADTVQTANDGRYTVDGLEADTYKVYFSDCSGRRSEDAQYAFEWYGDTGDFEAAAPITLSGGEDETDIDAALAQGGEISGTVTDQSTGSGIASICVLVINPLDYSFADQVETAANGSYTAGGLRSQEYRVKFSDCTSTRTGNAKYGFEFFEDVLTIDEATPVTVDGTRTTSGVHAALRQAGSISGTVTAPGGGGLAGACVDVVYQGYHSVAGATTGDTGTYTVRGLPPDQYTVAFYDCDEQDPELGFEWFNGRSSVEAADRVTVSPGQTRTGVNGSLELGGSISGNVRPDGGEANVADICAVAHDAQVHDRPVLGARTGTDGNFTIDHLRAGNDYKVEYFDCRRDDRRYRLEYFEGGDGQSLLFPSGDALTVSAGGTEQASETLGDIVDRAAGEQRIQTAVDISHKGFESSDVVVISRHDEYPDALAGAPLAHAVDAPILLTPSGFLHEDTRAEIERLGADEAILLGQHNALSQTVEDEVAAIVGADDVRRVGGADRYGTARDIAVQPELDGATHVYVTEGDNAQETRGWPDAISGGALAAHLGRPILLTLHDVLPQETREALRDLPSGSDATIIGGPVAVSEDVEDAIDTEVDIVSRLAGEDRYETSRIVATVSEDARNTQDGTELSPNRMWLARGDDWPDALAGGPTVARDLGVLLIVPQTGLETHTRGFLQQFSDEIHRVLLLGGPEALFPQVVQDVRDAIDAGSAFGAQSTGGGAEAATTPPFLFPGSDAWRTLIAGE